MAASLGRTLLDATFSANRARRALALVVLGAPPTITSLPKASAETIGLLSIGEGAADFLKLPETGEYTLSPQDGRARGFGETAIAALS
jgi:hypothetical protein